MPDIASRHVVVGVDLANGVAIHRIRDAFTRHEFLPRSSPGSRSATPATT
jgi:hypothetical protein